MSIPVSIEMLLNENVVEASRIAFKESFTPNPIIQTISAYANDIDNTGGGYVIVGVEEKDGAPVFPVQGVPRESVDGILEKILYYSEFIEPSYIPRAEPVEYQGKILILIWAKGGTGRPYRAPADVTSEDSEKVWFIRKQSVTIKASEKDLKTLYSVSQSIPFDDMANLTADLEDLDRGLLVHHLAEIESPLLMKAEEKSAADLARDMQLVQGLPEFEKPVNAALLFFCQHPETYFRRAWIDTVIMPDPGGDGMIEKRFTGPIQNQLRECLQYLNTTCIYEKVRKVPGRAEAIRSWNYPFSAIEEILANAIYHKSYRIQEPITVRVGSNQVEITFCPGFDSSISDRDVSQFRIRSRIYRNRRIGDLLKELKLIEGRNTGFPTALAALEANGSAPLKFRYDQDRQFLSVIIPVHPDFVQNKGEQTKEDAYIKEILECLQDEPLSLTQLAKKMGYKGITSKLRRTVDKLKNLKKLEYVSSGRREIKLKVISENDSV